MPPDTALTRPEVRPIVATDVVPLLQLPPVVASPKVTVVPLHIGDVPPVIADGL